MPRLTLLTLLGSGEELHSLHSSHSFPRSCCPPGLVPGAPSTPCALTKGGCGHIMGQNTGRGTQIPFPGDHRFTVSASKGLLPQEGSVQWRVSDLG